MTNVSAEKRQTRFERNNKIETSIKYVHCFKTSIIFNDNSDPNAVKVTMYECLNFNI